MRCVLLSVLCAVRCVLLSVLCAVRALRLDQIVCQGHDLDNYLTKPLERWWQYSKLLTEFSAQHAISALGSSAAQLMSVLEPTVPAIVRTRTALERISALIDVQASFKKFTVTTHSTHSAQRRLIFREL